MRHAEAINWTAVFAVCLLATSSTPGQPENILYIEPQEVRVNDGQVAIPIWLDNADVIYGFQLSLATDPEKLSIDSLSIEGTVADGAEWSDGLVLDEGGWITWGVVLELMPPFDVGHIIPPASHQRLANLVLHVTARQEGSTMVRFEDRPGDPAAKNKLVREEGTPVGFTSFDGPVEITGVVFLRGDSNSDGGVDLSDGIYTLDFLFLGGPGPLCGDAADADDGGALDLSDAIYLLNHLFLGGPPPPPPFPEAGIDPTADDLECAGE